MFFSPGWPGLRIFKSQPLLIIVFLGQIPYFTEEVGNIEAFNKDRKFGFMDHIWEVDPFF